MGQNLWVCQSEQFLLLSASDAQTAARTGAAVHHAGLGAGVDFAMHAALRMRSAKRGEGADIARHAGSAGLRMFENGHFLGVADFHEVQLTTVTTRAASRAESIAVSGLYDPPSLEAVHRRLDLAYTTLMDAAKRKEYDGELFPDGVPMPLSWRILFQHDGLPWVLMLAVLALLSVGSSLTRPPLFGMVSNLTPNNEQGATIGLQHFRK